MNVCVLAIGRTASTNLYYTISRLYEFDNIYCEPFFSYRKKKKYKSKNTNEINFNGDVLLKQLVNDYVFPSNIKTMEELFIWISNNFPYIICLYRDDIKSQYESFAYHFEHNTLEDNWWHKPKDIDVSSIGYEYIEHFKKLCVDNTIKIKNFAINNNYPLIKYEDLIENEGDNDAFRKICEYINVDFNYDIIYEFFKKENKVSHKKNKHVTHVQPSKLI